MVVFFESLSRQTFKKNVFCHFSDFFSFCFSNTALHLCAIHDKAECMKLLLRSGADASIRNVLDKTPLDIAKEKGHRSCEELVSMYFLL